MVIQIFKNPRPPKEPLLNEIGAGLAFSDQQKIISGRIMRHLKSTPELIGILDTLVTDHFLGPVDFFDVDEKPLGSTRLKNAKKWWVDKEVRRTFQGTGFDYFVDGSSFGWWNNISNSLSSKQKELLTKVKDLGFDELVDKMVREPRKISYLPATTVEIVHNSEQILGYKQDAAGKVITWKPENVVHIKLMEWNGEVRGFSGIKALVHEIALMQMIKINLHASLENGGSPDNLIGMKNANGTSKARFDRFKTAMESFTHIRKSHGNMTIDADVTVQPLGSTLKDMEYRELAMFVLSEFALASGIPTSRIPFMMVGSGGTANKGELSGNSEDAYEKKKNNRRITWEDKWNPIFRKAGFMFRFRRDNLQDDVRETTAATQRSAYVKQVQESLAKTDKQLTLNAHLELLSGTKRNIGLDDIEKLVVPESQSENETNINNQNNKSSDIDLKSRVSRDRSASKMRSASNNGVST